jgi:hypothetical protein
MSSRWSDQWRLSVHPLFSLLIFPLVKIFRLLGLDSALAVRATIAGTAAIWMASLFGLLRLIGCRRLDASLFALIAALSAASLFWFAVPETYPFGSVSIIWALGLVAWAQQRSLPATPWVIVSVLTLSFTITNWMAGVVAAWVSHAWRRSAQITVNAFCVVVVLWAVESRVFPDVPFFLADQRYERLEMLRREAGGVVAVAKAFVYHPMIMPAIGFSHPFRVYPPCPSLTVQLSSLGSGGPWGAIATGFWTGLLGLGGWAALTLGGLGRVRVALAMILLGQFGLHLLYGVEIFLYSLHWLPLLVVMAALASLSPLRPLALALAFGLLVAISVNNVQHLHHAVQLVNVYPGHLEAR